MLSNVYNMYLFNQQITAHHRIVLLISRPRGLLQKMLHRTRTAGLKVEKRSAHMQPRPFPLLLFPTFSSFSISPYIPFPSLYVPSLM